MKGPYLANKFELTTSSDLKRLSSKGKTTYGQTVEAVAIAQPPTFSCEFVRIDKEALVLAFLGTEAAETQSAGTVSSGSPESVTIPANASVDSWYPLAHFKTTSVVIKDVTNATTYVEGEDYQVNAELGWIKLLPGGDVVPGGSPITLHASYTYAVSSGVKIKGSTNAQVRAAFYFDGINQVDQLPVTVNVWEAILTSSGAFDFLADDFNKVTLNGDMKTPVGKDNPFEVVLRTT
jgi:hypothetical protein